MLRYFKVSVKKTKNKGIITDNSKKGSIIVKRVIPEVQIGVGIGEMNGVGRQGQRFTAARGTPSVTVLR